GSVCSRTTSNNHRPLRCRNRFLSRENPMSSPAAPRPDPLPPSFDHSERGLEILADVVMLVLSGVSIVFLLVALWLDIKVSLLTSVLVLGGLLVLALVFQRAGWLKLVGPLLFYDMLRSARRGRFVWVRCGYAALLLFILFASFLGSRYHTGMGAAAAEARMA